MSMEKQNFNEILDDIKLISKAVKIVRDENNPENRKFACSLVNDLVSRLYRDVKEAAGIKGSEDFKGYIEEGDVKG